MTNTLPQELTVRAPTLDDLEAVAGLVEICDIADSGQPDDTLEDLWVDWNNPELNLETDAWVVVEPGEEIVGYGVMFNKENVRLHLLTYVHPEQRGRGIGSHLLRMGEARAGEQVSEAAPGLQVRLFNSTNHTNHAARELLERAGYNLVRHFYRMQIDMEQAPPEPEWPEGLSVRTFATGQDERATFEAIEEAFEDHWGYIPGHFETWQQVMFEREGFDPGLWFLAMDGEQIAGALMSYNYAHEGWVDDLGVRRPWRRRGLGLALLRHAFGEFYRRQQHRVALGVDSQNTSGATRLYERAGMRVVRQFDVYQKILHPGKDPTAQGEPGS